jgi:AcrR family transcriptional regulator
MAYPTRTRGRPRDARVETAVVEATVAEIAEKGLAAATMEGIAARAGVARATMYRRWPSKEALLYFLADQLSDVFEPADTGDLRKDLLSVFVPLAIQAHGDGPLARLLPTFIAEAAHDEQIRQFVTGLIASRQTGAIEALRRAQRRGELRGDVDVNITVAMISGAFSVRSLWMGKRVTAAYVRKVVDHALDGIAAPRAPH